MSPRTPPAAALWIQNRIGVDESLAGDLLEEFNSGRSPAWYWLQLFMAIFALLRYKVRIFRIQLQALLLGCAAEAIVRSALWEPQIAVSGAALVGLGLLVWLEGHLSIGRLVNRADLAADEFQWRLYRAVVFRVMGCTWFAAGAITDGVLWELTTSVKTLVAIHIWFFCVAACQYLRSSTEREIQRGARLTS